ncbi:SRPBCC domain-containing protein [Streptomyces sp. NPDC048269]|uniref:SRPBCC domain-containing protein n=1 Tax=Streptomyces sp. NPDC048269 TaxID=3155753 RepID=UPI00343D8A5B
MPPVSHGTSESPGEGRLRIRFELHLPYGYEELWPALTTREGLRGWLAEAEVLERRLGGAVTWHQLGSPMLDTGRVTAWDVERVVEYTVGGDERIRFHLEAVGTDSTVIRFITERGGTERGGTERAGPDEAGRADFRDSPDALDCLAVWHEHFELLESALAGRPVDWITWTGARRDELREDYASLSRA